MGQNAGAAAAGEGVTPRREGGVRQADKGRTAWLDLARGGSIVLVVMYHVSILLTDHNLIAPLYWKANWAFTSIRMPVFFGISGLLAAGAIARDWRSLMRSRVLLLWYLYVLWMSIQVPVGLMVGRDIAPLDLLRQMWIPHPVLWFIWALGFYVIIAKLARGRCQIPVMAIASLASIVTFSDVFSASLEQEKAINYLPFFLAGAWYGDVILQMLKRPWAALAVAGLAYAALYTTLKHHWLPSGFEFLLCMLGQILGFSAAVLIARAHFISRPIEYLGKNTLPIYVAHFAILTLLVEILLIAGVEALAGVRIWLPLVLIFLGIWLSLEFRRALVALGASWFYHLPQGRVHRVA